MGHLIRLSSLAAGTVLLIATQAGSMAHAQQAVPLEQGWTTEDVNWWYRISQGSRLLPKAWLAALEQPGSDRLFLAPDHIARFKYLPEGPVDQDGLQLPIGFVTDTQPDSLLSGTKLRWSVGQGNREPWIGMNCAACHTGKITYQGKDLYVQGGATLADFQSFMTALNQALRETQSQPDKWKRFAARVLAGKDTTVNRTMLDQALQKLIAWERRVETQNATALPYGFGRLDAIGHIMNKVALSTGAAQTPWPSDAPVSYPFIWNAPRHDKVQWNGVAPNGPTLNPGPQELDIGALGRNTGEVIGVFADIRIETVPNFLFRSSVRTENLIAIEQRLGKLMSPRWPDSVFPPVDLGQRDRGQALYQRDCVSCHHVIPWNAQLTTGIQAQMVPLRTSGTDIWMACNAFKYQANAGKLQGHLLFNGLGSLKRVQSGEQLLKATIGGVLLNDADAIIRSAARGYSGSGERGIANFGLSVPALSLEGFAETFRVRTGPLKQRLERECLTEDNPLLAYKARPLNGIWATAPYLHNGSVPTLYDLLLPPNERPTTFQVGNREFDPVKVGLATTPLPEGSFEFRVQDSAGTIVPGNSNRGHDYNNSHLSDQERMDLIAYLKTL